METPAIPPTVSLVEPILPQKVPLVKPDLPPTVSLVETDPPFDHPKLDLQFNPAKSKNNFFQENKKK